jgi:hypothetical protein
MRLQSPDHRPDAIAYAATKWTQKATFDEHGLKSLLQWQNPGTDDSGGAVQGHRRQVKPGEAEGRPDRSGDRVEVV